MTAAGVSSSNRESLIASPSPLATRDPSLRSRAGSLLATRMSVVIVVAFGAEQLEPEARLGRTDVTSLAGRGVQGGGGKLGERERFPLKRDVDLLRFQIPAAGPTALNPPAGPGELALILEENGQPHRLAGQATPHRGQRSRRSRPRPPASSSTRPAQAPQTGQYPCTQSDDRTT